jgi:hypothetical protein
MAIQVPISKTIISTTQWGIPITNEVNRVAGLVDGRTPTTWVLMTSGLTNGWSYFGGGTTQPRYRKIGDMVYMEGTIKNGAVLSAPAQLPFYTLPAGFRPLSQLLLPCLFGGGDTWGGAGRLDVNSAGVVSVVTSASMTGATNLVGFTVSFSTL